MIQFDRYVEVFGYHYLHTQEDFLSDVGGFLGLFLGLSIFAVISLALDVAEKGGGKGKRGDDAGTDTSSSGISRKVFGRRNHPKFTVKYVCFACWFTAHTSSSKGRFFVFFWNAKIQVFAPLLL